ncbi:PhoX family phosphatase [Salinisphaera sp. Q1T1-3]|uniref:PhoX family protein n=1 Tax=Salinisphaera sp. Q1T1-3 TaxID=2321229 RepID=UPI000E7639FA|nr:PhoX family phosphatase [Salinisphaera sp. Q1T1-3]RJS93229.1 PhoX family phosphatase [Salinisphaera sp. Q1T1-3]
MSEEVEDHRLFNDSDNEPFSSVLTRRLSRRDVMRGGMGVAAATMLAGFGLTGCNDDDRDVSVGDDDDTAPALALAFQAVAGSRTDAVVVPSGYTAQVLIPWGTPIDASAPAWTMSQHMTPAIQASSVGMNHDGMYHFPLADDTASRDFVLAMNNEYINQGPLWAPQGGPTAPEDNDGRRPVDEVRTEINAHGVTLVRLRKDDDAHWAPVMDANYNRRITGHTPCRLSGPVAGSPYVVTAYSNGGTATRGTMNNCACGYTPWGTYLTCEENWPNLFMKSDDRDPDDDRLGIWTDDTIYHWQTAAGTADEDSGEFARFDATPSADAATGDYRNEPKTYGYVVEINPYDNTARPVKRTALGRFRHEGCWPGKLVEGEPVVFYTGHDSRNEYIYKYVSDAVWDSNHENRAGANTDRLAVGDLYMDAGTLYVARFNADGSGDWLALTPDAMTKSGDQTLAAALGLAANDQAGVIINTADAADLLGATPMDRPEWGTVDPVSGDVYMSLTNNSDRTAADTQPSFTGDGTSIDNPGVGYASAPVNAANPRPDNEYGQVIRWRESDAKDNTFAWDIFVFGGAPEIDDNLSGLTEANQFASPDGLWYDDRGDGNGILWIETDNGGNRVAEDTNDQVLAVVPKAVSLADGDAAVIDPADQAQLKRFTVGPNGCEITGIFATPDKSALFINIQHPGNWPSMSDDATAVTNDTVRPRASTVVIQKSDGGPIAV